MIEMIKVLFVDDEKSVYKALSPRADMAGIDLDYYSNWEDAEKALKRNYDEYSAIILDAYCKMKDDGDEKNWFLSEVLRKISSLSEEKHKVIPWYILSAGTMTGFNDSIEGLQYGRAEFEEEWGRMLYIKTQNAEGSNNENDPVPVLFGNIKRVAEELPYYSIIMKHRDVFKYIGEGKQFDKRIRKMLLRMLSALYFPEENINYEYAGNPIRKVLEYVFRSALKYGLLPDECIENDILKLQLCSLFLAGKSVSYDSSDKNKKVRWGNGHPDDINNPGDYIFTNEIRHIVKSILDFTNADSHTVEEEKWFVYEETKEIFFGNLMHICYLIKWLGKYIEEHNDVEANKKMFSRFYDGKKESIVTDEILPVGGAAKEKYEGKTFVVSVDDKNNYYADDCLLPFKSSQKRLGKIVKLIDVVYNDKRLTRDRYKYRALKIEDI